MDLLGAAKHKEHDHFSCMQICHLKDSAGIWRDHTRELERQLGEMRAVKPGIVWAPIWLPLAYRIQLGTERASGEAWGLRDKSSAGFELSAESKPWKPIKGVRFRLSAARPFIGSDVAPSGRSEGHSAQMSPPNEWDLSLVSARARSSIDHLNLAANSRLVSLSLSLSQNCRRLLHLFGLAPRSFSSSNPVCLNLPKLRLACSAESSRSIYQARRLDQTRWEDRVFPIHSAWLNPISQPRRPESSANHAGKSAACQIKRPTRAHVSTSNNNILVRLVCCGQANHNTRAWRISFAALIDGRSIMREKLIRRLIAARLPYELQATSLSGQVLRPTTQVVTCRSRRFVLGLRLPPTCSDFSSSQFSSHLLGRAQSRPQIDTTAGMAEIFLFNEIAKIELLFLYLHLTDSICAFLFGVGGADESSRTLERSNGWTVGRMDVFLALRLPQAHLPSLADDTKQQLKFTCRAFLRTADKQGTEHTDSQRISLKACERFNLLYFLLHFALILHVCGHKEKDERNI